jgi:hypothetical protein
MVDELHVLPGGAANKQKVKSDVSADTMLRHFRNVNSSILQDALDAWANTWEQLQGSLTCGVMVDPEVETSFQPDCGWPEFLEKLWVIKYYLDYAKRFCNGRP